MASLESLKMRKYAAKGTIIQRVGQDTPVAIKVKYIGTSTITSVVVTTGTDIVFTTAAATDTIDFATYTTIGAVVDAINGTGRWQAMVVDALRSAASVSRLFSATVTAATDEVGASVYNIKLDTSSGLQYAVCLSPFTNFDAPKGHAVKLQEIKYGINMTTPAVNSVQIWKRLGTVETQVFGGLSVDTTETTISWASGVGYIGGNVNEEIIVLVKDAAQLDDATTNYIQVVGVIE